MTGHAGSSISTLLGVHVGDELSGSPGRHAVAVIGDGAFPSGIVFEAMNNVGGMKKKILMILNDNRMSICPRVGGLASYLDRLRTNPVYTGLKTEVVRALNKMPVLGDPAERFLAQLKEGIKAGLHGGMLFEDLGFRYIGPIDGHNIGLLRKYLQMVKNLQDPVLLHVVTEKGHGFQPAAEDPTYFHTPPVFVEEDGKAIPQAGRVEPSRTRSTMRDAIVRQMRQQSAGRGHDRRHVPGEYAGTGPGRIPRPLLRHGDLRVAHRGLCGGHGQGRACGPIVDIYSTFLQRAYDQVFQEVALQRLPVVFTMDRAGLTGPDGPTHHGVFDIVYMRAFPHLVVMAPGDAHDVDAMLDFALQQDAPCAIRYPKASAHRRATRGGRVAAGSRGNSPLGHATA